jgi:hypothetical protein
VQEAIYSLSHNFRRQLHKSLSCAKVSAAAAISRDPVIIYCSYPEARAYPEIQHEGFERMPRDGGFHPFKGRVSKHFGESVGSYLPSPCGLCASASNSNIPMCVLRAVRRILTRTLGQLQLAPDDPYLSCEDKHQAAHNQCHG